MTHGVRPNAAVVRAQQQRERAMRQCALFVGRVTRTVRRRRLRDRVLVHLQAGRGRRRIVVVAIILVVRVFLGAIDVIGRSRVANQRRGRRLLLRIGGGGGAIGSPLAEATKRRPRRKRH